MIPTTNTATRISQQLQEKVDNEIHDGETIEWMDQPILHYFSLLCGLMVCNWLVFTLFTVVSGILLFIYDGPYEIFAMLIPLFFFGFLFLLLPYIEYQNSLTTVYVITNKRVIIICGHIGVTIKSYANDKLDDIYRREYHDGSGDVIFSKEWFSDINGNQTKKEIGIFNITNPKLVEEKIWKLASNKSSCAFFTPTPTTNNRPNEIVIANAKHEPEDDKRVFGYVHFPNQTELGSNKEFHGIV
jgi:hypothetical protein